VAVFGDEGIHQKVGQKYWEEEVNKMLVFFKEAHLGDGVCQVVNDIGEVLHTHFPTTVKQIKTNCRTILYLADSFMKRLLFIISLLFSIGAYAQSTEQFVLTSIPKPNPPRLVNDFANVLTPAQEQALESKLVAYDDSTSNQVAIITITSTGDYEIGEVALEVLRQWGVGGQAGKDNGVVLLAAINDRKIYIATGYGLEGAIPDITAKNIIENDIIPQFRQDSEGNYYRGLDEATNSIIAAAAGEYRAPADIENQVTRIAPALPVSLLAFLF
jgi:uncharacterized membrane protein YgcG